MASNKRSVAWHKDGLNNSLEYAANLEKEAHLLLVKAGSIRDQAAVLTKQIERAEREGRDGFDANTYKAR